MSYGTFNGVKNNLIDYEELIEREAITEEMVEESRLGADGIIDARLAKAAPAGMLPLAEPPAIVGMISDDLTTYFILRRLFTGKDPNDSEWVDKFYTRPMQLLETLAGNPEIMGAAGASGRKASSTTENQDRIFTVSRTSGGAETDDGTMDKW